MKLLAIETSTEALSVAVLHGDAVHAHHEAAPRRHGELLLPAVERLLADAGLELGQLDAIAFGRGPGAFTGVRIAVAAAQGLAFAAGLPLVPVSTLASLAQAAADRHRAQAVIAVIDARMNEVYAGWFAVEDGLVVATAGEWLGHAEALPDFAGGPWFGAGSGFGAQGGILAARLGERLAGSDPALLPDARATLRLAARAFAAGETVAPEQAMPVYLRDRVT